jgi:hypothetical protein
MFRMYTSSSLAVMLLIALAFWGYGRCLQRLCAAGLAAGAGETACFGLAGYLAACGFIELAAAASAALLVGIVLGGLALAVLATSASRSARTPGAAAMASPAAWLPPRAARTLPSRLPLLAMLLLAAAYLAFLVNVAWWHFLAGDDTAGYLVLPTRILQTGSTGIDPFLFRRVEAGLGGGSYLYALQLALLPFPVARLADLGLGSLLLALQVGRHAREARPDSPAVVAGCLGLAFAVLLFTPTVNLAPDLPAIALFYAAIRFAWRLAAARDLRAGRHLLFGLLVFGLVCLRSTYLVPAFAVAAALYLTLLWTMRSLHVVLAAALAFAVVVAFAAPWMVVLHRIAGTPYYPLFGFGTMTHAEVGGFTALPILAKTAGRILCCALLGLAALDLLRRRATARPPAFATVFAALLLGLTLLAQTKYTVFGWRYAYVAVATLPLLLFVEACATAPSRRWRAVLAGALALFLLALQRHQSWHPDTVASGQLYVAAAGRPVTIFDNIVDATADRVALRHAARAMQDSVPPGARMLVRMANPFLLDFRRNPIWVMDHPGLCGPAPGVPTDADVAAWTAYLRANGVGFVAYAYLDHAGEPPQNDALFMRTNGPSHFQDVISTQAAAVQAMLLNLRNAVPVVYDDGTRFVAALAARSQRGADTAPRAYGTGMAPVREADESP